MSVDLTQHFKYMAISLFVGYKALLNNETPVSCIVVNSKANEIISIGYNYTNHSLNGTQHAEFIALQRFEDDEDFNYEDLTLYVTVEPCIMCASYLRQLGIGKVVFGCGNDRFGGNGTVMPIHRDPTLPHKPYLSVGGICRAEGIQLLRNFYIQQNEAAPNPKVKKNTDIESKEYPGNEFMSLDKEEFLLFYGKDREEVYDSSDLEITPKVGTGYDIKEFINLKELQDVPFLQDELGEVTAEQIIEFNNLFFNVNDDGRINYDKAIGKYNSKKRHLEDV
ncbi:tRNA-specific adenosine deaminase subunit TAD2 [Candida viswanathii]|uniref:tRNA-specific adenosine deaminase subunit TAD2 n=1 Tax=Candida viswanathii TaxID=5486 RepID=A0A367YL88_9ASCO|nr:tRNA-specific adenosine deaminase subunit TAD2 [Candida viswanathii]